ncbi:MAG: YgdI/YgdR family lipoprotein [Akkermansiaceae bacterium]|nr:YgdI/YgdR family lipoprotein [Akkermansiaceae bacterium]
MKNLHNLAVLTILSLMLSACCSDAQPRFWQVRDTADGRTAYTVDTVAVPSSSLMPVDIKYVDAAGNCVDVVSPKPVRQMSEQEWRTATSGGRYSLRYCGLRKNCWAKAKGR